MDFNTFNLHPRVAAGVGVAGFTTPTPIQAQAIPKVLLGRDVIGLAQTGTGKTAAFVLPLLHRLTGGPRGCVRALIIAPTRELAEQIHGSILSLGRRTRIRSVTVYGGVGIEPQVTKLRGGAEIVVACPGRLLDHLHRKTVDLRRLEVLVLDEADHMFDMGFAPDIRRILKHVPQRRQTLLFSATMPQEIRRLAEEILRDPVAVQVGPTAPADTVSHAVYPVEAHRKTALLLALLERTDTESVLIFTRTKYRARRLGDQLRKAGLRATSLQGNLSQSKRQAALRGFRDGSYDILVATDIAARGIDVSQVSHVINFDMPNTTEAYIHRIGRTGRVARKGDAFSLVSGEDTAMVRAIEGILKGPLDRCRLPGFDYGIAAPGESGGSRRPARPSAGGRRRTERRVKPAYAYR